LAATAGWLQCAGSCKAGAGGAVAGVVLGAGDAPARTPARLQVVGLNLMIGYAGHSFIDNVGHVGGLLGGAALMLLVGPRYRWASGAGARARLPLAPSCLLGASAAGRLARAPWLAACSHASTASAAQSCCANWG
jgi:hypothetical protein